MPSTRKTKPSNPKKYSWIVIVLAIAVLGINALLSRQGTPLPDEITDAAEIVLQESLQGAVATTEPETAVATPRPTPAAAVSAPVTVSSSAEFYNPDADFDYYVLALSWEPAFCETRPSKPECTSQTEARFDAANFILHGLWPNRNNDPNHTLGYCDVPQNQIRLDEAGDWCDLPPLGLSAGVAQTLDTTMPGTQSCLQNHEWYKHGTCTGLSADAYYDLGNQLAQKFSQTEFNRTIAANTGRTVERGDLLNQFAAEFGSSDYLSLRCDEVDGVDVLTEIQITLKKDLTNLGNWASLFPADPPRISGSCPRQFKIDSVGLGNL